MLGNSTTYTYIAPFLNAAGSAVSIEILLVVFGIASIGGIALTAALVDRRPRTPVVGCLAGFTISGLVLFVGHESPVTVYAAIALWGLTFGGASPQLQRPLSAVSGNDADVANSFLPVAFNLAIFAAGILGAAVLNTAGALALPLTIWSAFLFDVNAVNEISATSAREIHRFVASSKMASVYWIVFHASSGMLLIAVLTRGSRRTVTETSAPDVSAAETVGWP